MQSVSGTKIGRERNDCDAAAADMPYRNGRVKKIKRRNGPEIIPVMVLSNVVRNDNNPLIGLNSDV